MVRTVTPKRPSTSDAAIATTCAWCKCGSAGYSHPRWTCPACVSSQLGGPVKIIACKATIFFLAKYLINNSYFMFIWVDVLLQEPKVPVPVSEVFVPCTERLLQSFFSFFCFLYFFLCCSFLLFLRWCWNLLRLWIWLNGGVVLFCAVKWNSVVRVRGRHTDRDKSLSIFMSGFTLVTYDNGCSNRPNRR